MAASNVFSGLGHGVLGLLGIGQAYDPMGNLRGQIASENQKINNMVNTATLQVAQVQSKDMQDMFNFIGTQTEVLNASIQKNNQLIWDGLKQENLFLAVLTSVVIIMLFFRLISKKCC